MKTLRPLMFALLLCAVLLPSCAVIDWLTKGPVVTMMKKPDQTVPHGPKTTLVSASTFTLVKPRDAAEINYGRLDTWEKFKNTFVKRK